MCWQGCDNGCMEERTKSTHDVVADNLRRIAVYRCLSDADAAKMLGVKTFVWKRILAADHAMTLKTLDRLARVFGYEPYQLVIPDLDPANPQVLRILSAVEQRLYEALEAARANGSR